MDLDFCLAPYFLYMCKILILFREPQLDYTCMALTFNILSFYLILFSQTILGFLVEYLLFWFAYAMFLTGAPGLGPEILHTNDCFYFFLI